MVKVKVIGLDNFEQSIELAGSLYQRYGKRLTKTMAKRMKTIYAKEAFDSGDLTESITYRRHGPKDYRIFLGDSNTVNKYGDNYAQYIEEGRGPTIFYAPPKSLQKGTWQNYPGKKIRRGKKPAVNSVTRGFKYAAEKTNRYITQALR